MCKRIDVREGVWAVLKGLVWCGIWFLVVAW